MRQRNIQELSRFQYVQVWWSVLNERAAVRIRNHVRWIRKTPTCRKPMQTYTHTHTPIRAPYTLTSIRERQTNKQINKLSI